MINLTHLIKLILNEDVRTKEDVILKALRGHNVCLITSYTSNANWNHKKYGSVPDKRYGVILAYGIGRFNDEKCIRIVQLNRNASYGQKLVPPEGSDYKILYLKDISNIEITPSKIAQAPSEFNPDTDKWMKSVIEVAKFDNFIPKARYRNEKNPLELPIDRVPKGKLPTIDVTKYSRTTQERYKELKSIANTFLNIYNMARRKGEMGTAQKAIDKFRETQKIANQYMAAYKKENIKKTDTEKNIIKKLK